MDVRRKAHKRVAKELVEGAHVTSLAGCIKEHRDRRHFVAQALDAMCIFCSTDPDRLAKHRQLILAALAYARQEVLWYFLHINEVASPEVSSCLQLLCIQGC